MNSFSLHAFTIIMKKQTAKQETREKVRVKEKEQTVTARDIKRTSGILTEEYMLHESIFSQPLNFF
jgi:hypothetical protein